MVNVPVMELPTFLYLSSVYPTCTGHPDIFRNMTLLLNDLLVDLLLKFPLCDLTSPRNALVNLTVLLMAPFLIRLITIERSVRETE